MIFNIPKLLEFLDDPDTKTEGSLSNASGNRGHSTSIIGLIGEDLNAAVFRHYSDSKLEILSENVVQGFKKVKKMGSATIYARIKTCQELKE